MTDYYQVDFDKENPASGIRSFLKNLLALEDISAVLVPTHLPMKNMIMPTLVTDPEQFEYADFFAPAFPLNAARIVAKLTQKPMGNRIALVLRPCEIRAVIELTKLHQVNLEEVLLVGSDCLGALSNTDYLKFAVNTSPSSTKRFLDVRLIENKEAVGDFMLMNACRVCEHPIPQNTDIHILIYGLSAKDKLLVKTDSDIGKNIMERINMPKASEPTEREQAIEILINSRIDARDEMYAATAATIGDMGKLGEYLSQCINCYNCRVACPVCYCKECVFNTDAMEVEPAQYLQRAKRHGRLKMPADTLFYHITRLAHMSTACVGCGQCSNACPNNIRLMELFRLTAHHAQKGFDYLAGRDLLEKPPLSEFNASEFSEVVGI